jgi:hypothetical protein
MRSITGETIIAFALGDPGQLGLAGSLVLGLVDIHGRDPGAHDLSGPRAEAAAVQFVVAVHLDLFQLTERLDALDGTRLGTVALSHG